MDLVLWLLAVYGGWQLVGALRRWLRSFRQVPPRLGLLFVVQDNEDSIEGLIRQLALDCYFLGNYHAPDQVMVADLGSRDQSFSILQRLAREFSFLHLRQIDAAEIGLMTASIPNPVLVLDMRVLAPRQARRIIRLLLCRSEPASSRPTPSVETDSG